MLLTKFFIHFSHSRSLSSVYHKISDNRTIIIKNINIIVKRFFRQFPENSKNLIFLIYNSSVYVDISKTF